MNNKRRQEIDEVTARMLLDLMPGPAWISDQETLQFLAVNKSTAEFFGIARRELLRLTIRDIQPKDHALSLAERLEKNQFHKPTTRHQRANGDIVSIGVNAKAVSFSGRNALFVVGREEDENHALLEALQQQEYLFKVAEKIGSMGSWAYEIASDRLIWSEGTYKIFGLNRNEFDGTIDAFVSLVHENDREKLLQAQSAADYGEKLIDLTYRIVTPAGEERAVRERGVVLHDKNGRPERRIGVITDNTEQKAIAAQLSQSQSLVRLAGEIGKLGGWYLDINAEAVYWSEEVFAIHDLSPSANLSIDAAINFFVPDFQQKACEVIKGCCKQGAHFDEEFQIESAKGVLKWVRCIGRPVYDEHGQVIRVEGALQDVSDLRKSEERLHIIESSMKHIDDVVLITNAHPIEDAGPKIVYVNDAFVKQTGYAREEAIGQTPGILHGPNTQLDRLGQVREALKRQEPIRTELLSYSKSGKEMLMELSIVPVRNAQQEVTHFVSVRRDVSERVATEHELAQKESRFRAVAQATADIIWDWDLKRNLVWWNEGYTKTFGHALSSSWAPIDSWTDYIHPDDFERVLKKVDDAIKDKTPEWEDEYRFLNSKGEALPVLDRGFILFDSNGDPAHFVGGMVDLRQREAARAILQKNKERLKRHISHVSALTRSANVREATLQSKIVKSAQALVGSDGAAIAVAHGDEFVYEAACGIVNRSVRVPIEGSLSGAALESGKTLVFNDVELEEFTLKPKAHAIGLRSMVVAALPGESGPLGVLKVMSRLPNAFTQEDANFISLFAQSAGALLVRRSIESRLSQAQRLEAVGQLTGGIAHDFNNLLTVILGNAETLEKEYAVGDPMLQVAQLTRAAAERGAELTSRLLAFSRRQPLEPSSRDVNKLISSMELMLRRTIGEHICFRVVKGAGLWPAMVDAAQLESAILNLCLNARDAMPEGGKLTIETSNVRLSYDQMEGEESIKPGQYVRIAVIDTGTGMTEEVRSRALEPFYSTKPKNKGSGMGLSMVFGFMKQSRGHMKLSSEPGIGTSVALYIPKAMSAPSNMVDAFRGDVKAKGEKILLVEDDNLVRGHVLSQLRMLGYNAIEARNAREALRVLREVPDIDLLFTDIVMPGGMSGSELANEAVALRPQLRVLFTSGYSDNAIVHEGRIDAGVNFIGKPFRQGELGKRIRKALLADCSR